MILRYRQKRTFTETLQISVSDKWTTSESEKAGLYGKIYDLVVDYEQISEPLVHKELITCG